MDSAVQYTSRLSTYATICTASRVYLQTTRLLSTLNLTSHLWFSQANYHEMSFGFSVGDFLAASKLIFDITTSLSESGGSKSEYQELFRELDSLSRALKHVERLDSHTGVSSNTLDSIKCAALLCRHPLGEFLTKVRKYEASLGV